MCICMAPGKKLKKSSVARFMLDWSDVDWLKLACHSFSFLRYKPIELTATLFYPFGNYDGSLHISVSLPLFSIVNSIFKGCNSRKSFLNVGEVAGDTDDFVKS